ncbi:MAG: RIP metalloprotease RseP [Desulfovibrionales bacterium]
MLTSTIAIVLVLGILIFFHELGHFLMARLFGIGVPTFSLGFGPKLWGFSMGKTQYRVSAVPLGGYVKLAGESRDAEIPEGFTEQESFIMRPPWQRMIVVAAGPVFNFILAWVIYFGLFWAMGQAELLPVIGTVVEDSPAAEAGIQEGDRITAISGDRVQNWEELATKIRSGEDQTLNLVLERDGQTLRKDITPRMETQKNIFGEEIQTPLIGISPSGDVEYTELGPIESAGASLGQTWELIRLTVVGIIKLVERIIPLETIGGPIMIAQLVGEQAQRGIVDVLALTALISINLGLLNLLPIPVLDGGHILFYAIETVTGKPLSERWQQITIRIGLALLLALMALAIYNDLARLFTPSE